MRKVWLVLLPSRNPVETILAAFTSALSAGHFADDYIAKNPEQKFAIQIYGITVWDEWDESL